MGTYRVDEERRTLGTLFNDAVVIVPPFQREYQWREEVDTFIHDALLAFDASHPHFLGPLVLGAVDAQSDLIKVSGVSQALLDDRTQSLYILVDGQQRITTCVLLLAEFKHVCQFIQDTKGGELFDVSRELLENVHSGAQALLSAKIKEGHGKSAKMKSYERFISNRNDHPTLQKTIGAHWYKEHYKDKETLGELSIGRNASLLKKAQIKIHNAFYDRYSKSEDVNDFLESFVHPFFLTVKSDLEFVPIVASEEYDAYNLFESLNAKGKDLGPADLLKNLVLGLGSKGTSLEELIDSWSKTEKLTKNTFLPFMEIVRSHWADRSGVVPPTGRKLYGTISESLRARESEGRSPIKLYVDELSDAAKELTVFQPVDQWPKNCNKSEAIFHEFTNLEYSIAAPLLLRLGRVSQRIGGEDQFVRVANNIFVFLFRLVTVGQYSVGIARNTVDECMTLTNTLAKIKETNKLKTEYDSAVAQVLRKFSAKSAPNISDKNFRIGFANFEVRKPSTIWYVLNRIESALDPDGTHLPDPSVSNVEHILPKKNSLWRADTEVWEKRHDVSGKVIHDLPVWIKEAMDKEEILQSFSYFDKKNDIDQWLHNIGNMTIYLPTANTSLGNKTFGEKLASYKESKNEITKKVVEIAEKNDGIWSPIAILARSAWLAEQAVSIWSFFDDA